MGGQSEGRHVHDPVNHHHYGKKEHVNMYLWNRANTVVIVVVFMPNGREGGPKKKKKKKKKAIKANMMQQIII
jgi:hypothetical protein